MAEKFQAKIDSIYGGLSKSHKKIADFIKNNYEKASFTVIMQDDIVPEKYTTLYRSVIAFGSVHIADDEAERIHGVQLLAEKYNPGEPEAGWRKEMADCPNFLILVMEIDHITGKASRELVE